MTIVPARPYIAGVLFIFLLSFDNAAYAQRTNQDSNDQQQTRQAQAISRALYEDLMEAKSLVDAEDYAAALDSLLDLYEPDSLNSYEQAQILQYLGIVYNALGDLAKAIDSYEAILELPDLEPGLLKRTIYVLAQLHTANEQYDAAMVMLTRWFEHEPNPGSRALVFRAQVEYQLGQFKDMIGSLETAIDIAESSNVEIAESWYSLLSYGYFRLEDYARVRDIQKVLLQNWPKKRYWSTLAGANSELGNETEFYSAYSAAYTNGLLDQESELVTMAQLYMQNDVPLKAATLLENEIELGRIDDSERNYRLLSQAWSLAQEDARAIPALERAARLSDNGEVDVQLGNAFLNLGRYEECLSAVRRGIDKGGLRNTANAYISLGMCHYNLQDYARARTAFRKARDEAGDRRLIDQWLRVIRDEVARNEQIEAAEANAREQVQALARRRGG